MAQPEAHPDNAGVLIFPPLLLAICAVLAILIGWLAPAAAIPAMPSYLLAAICVASGLALDRWAQRSLRRAQTAVHPSEATIAIVNTGAFGLSRNPIYLAQGILLAAVCFLVRNGWCFFALLPWLLVIRYGVIAREERYLLRKFGEPYARYLGEVRRWV